MSGLRIKLYREKNDYSQEDLAKILKVTRRTISRWEQNSSKPNPEELKNLANLIGVSEEDLLSDEDEIDVPIENSNQSVLERISDSVENLVTGQETINESLTINRDEYSKKQDELISELQNQNKQLVLKLNEQSELIESYKKALDLSKIELRHKKIRTTVIVVACLIVITLIFGTWLYLLNHGFSDERYVEGTCVTSGPRYYETDD